jgi:hypothetical protein
VAYLSLTPDDERHPDLQKCFDYEPSIQFLNTTETYRLFKERGIASEGLVDQKSLSTFRKLRDYNVLLLSIPRGGGALIRSFRLQKEQVIEGFIAKDALRCDSLFNWLNFLKVVSYPDNAYIFAERRYFGRTPRWIELMPGEHEIRVESIEAFIAKQRVTIPGKIQLLLRAE